MGKTTDIAWTDSTFNPWLGCTKVGPGCDNCYAMAQDIRFSGGVHWGSGAARHHTSVNYWRQPLLWNRNAERSGMPHRVFCGSQCDVFDNEVSDLWRKPLFDLIMGTRALTWQLVTKRIGNAWKMVPSSWRTQGFPAHVHIIATMVNQEEFNRDWPKLKALPARVRVLSIEPMLGPIEFSDDVRGNLHCAIYGGESFQKGMGQPRECKLEWLEHGLMQCGGHLIKPFVKQMGHLTTWNGKRMVFGGKGDDPGEWPEQFRVQEYPT